MSRTKRNRRFQYANQHASIQSRPNLNAVIGGESFTANREDELAASIFTDSANATQFALQLGGAELTFSGRQARTIQRLLNKHYSTCGSFTSEQPGV
jgi:hypothetical protein